MPPQSSTFQDDQVRELIRQQRAQEDEQVRQNAAPPAVTPDGRAEALQLQDKTGLDLDFIERNLDYAKQHARDQDTTRQLIRNPKVREFLASSPAAAAAADDVPAQVQLENRLTFGATILRGVDQQQALWGRFLSWSGQVMRQAPGGALRGIGERLDPYGRDVAAYNEQQGDALGYTTSLSSIKGPWDLAQWVKEQIGSQIPVMAPMVAGGAAGGKTGAMVGALAGPEGAVIGGTLGALIGAAIPAFVGGIGETEQNLKQLDPTKDAPGLVFLGGSAAGALDTAFPGLLGSRLVRTFGKETAEEIAKRALMTEVAPKFFRGLLHEGAVEMSTEAVTEALQEAIQQVTAAKGAGQQVDWRQVGQAMLEAGAAGAVVGGTFSAAGSAAVHHREVARFAAAEQGRAFFEALGSDVANAKLFARLPAAQAEFIARATKDGPLAHVYVPTQDFEAYWQKQGVDPAVMAAQLTGRADALAVAKQAGADLQVPMGDYATKLAPTEHNAFFQEVLRLAPEAMNYREAREFTKTFADLNKPVEERPPVSETVSQGAAQVGARIYQQAASAGMTEGQAQTLSQWYQSVYGQLAQRYGRDPVELFNRRPLQVELDNGFIFTPAAPGQPIGGVDIPASVAPKGETAEARRARRDLHLGALVTAYTRDAQVQDPQVDPAYIRNELEARVSMREEVQRAQRESGHGVDLLEELGAMGGLVTDRSGNDRGEIARLREMADKRDVNAPGRGRVTTWNGVSNLVRANEADGGVTIAQALERLTRNDDPRFNHIENEQDLLDAIEEAIAAKRDEDFDLPGTEELQALGVVPGTKWWEGSSWSAPAEEVVDESEPTEGDTSFNPEELEQREELLKPRPLEESHPRVRELEARATDQALGVTVPGMSAKNGEVIDEQTNGGASYFTINGQERFDLSPVNCTDCAEAFLLVTGEGGEIVGFPWPSRMAPNGHDFAIVESRFLVDPWGVHVEGINPRAVFDLEDPTDLAYVKQQYAPFEKWQSRVKLGEHEFRWVPYFNERLGVQPEEFFQTEPIAPQSERASHMDTFDEAHARLRQLDKAQDPRGQRDFRRVPMGWVDDRRAMAIWNAAGGMTANWTLQTVPFAALTATQQTVDREVVDEYIDRIKAGEVLPPGVAIEMGGLFYLTDGHHRSIARWLTGQGDVELQVASADQAEFEKLLGARATQEDIPSTPEGQALIARLDERITRQPKAGEPGDVPDNPVAQQLEKERQEALDQYLAQRGLKREELFQLQEANAPDGYEVVSEHLTPAELSRMKTNTAQQLVDAFESLPLDADYADVAQAGRAKKGWYERSTKAIRAVFGVVDAPRFTALLAAMSPQTSVESNLINALTMWANWIKAGRPRDRATIEKLLARSVQGSGTEASVLDAWTGNAVRALAAEDGFQVKLSGPKVQAFMQNLLGHMQETTLDAWMATFAGLQNKVLSGAQHKQESGEFLLGPSPRYLAMSAKLRRVAKSLTRTTGEVWTPAHVQETVWSWAKTLYELSKAEGTSAVRLLKEGGLTDAAIAATPDFGTLMAKDATFREILEAAGYGEVLGALEKEINRTDRRRARLEASRGEGAQSASAITPAILRSARRIDAIRQQRAAESESRAAAKIRDARRKVAEARRRARERANKGELYQTASGYGYPGQPGVFGTTTELAVTGKRQLGAARISTPEDLATAMQHMAIGAVERFDAVVTDRNDKPLAIVGSFKGAVDQAVVHGEVVLSEAVRVPGAANIWFVHNHPSGEPTLSQEDKNLERSLRERFRDSGITARGLMAIGQDGYAHIGPSKDPYGRPLTEVYGGKPRAAEKGRTVPIVEREFTSTAKLDQRIDSPQKSMAVIPGLAGGEFGAVLLDTKLAPVAFLPVNEGTALTLRSSQLPELLRGISIANPTSAIIHVPGDHLREQSVNLARALVAHGVDLVDIVFSVGGATVSARQLAGAPLRAEGEFFQREQKPIEGMYSRVIRTVRASSQEKATGAQWKATLRNAKVNLEEFRMVGAEALDDATVYTREKVAELLEASHIDVRVVTTDNRSVITDSMVEELAERLWQNNLDNEVQRLIEMDEGPKLAQPGVTAIEDEDENRLYYAPTIDGEAFEGDLYDEEDAALKAAEELAEQEDEQRTENFRDQVAAGLEWQTHMDTARERLERDHRDEDLTGYEEYSEEGYDKGSYREVFLTAPRASGTRTTLQLDAAPAGGHSAMAIAQVGENAAFNEIRHMVDRGEVVPAMEVARQAADRVRAELEKLSPIASNRGQLATALKALETLSKGIVYRRFKVEASWRDGHDLYDNIKNPIVRIRFDARTAADGTKTMFLEEVQPPGRDQQEHMPALFKKNWRELAFKWAVNHAVVNGYDQVVWTRGEVQASRYGLENVVRHVQTQQSVRHDPGVYPTASRVVNVNTLDGRQIAFLTDADGKVLWVSNARLETHIGEHLGAFLGVDAAAAILAPLPQRDVVVIDDNRTVPDGGLAELRVEVRWSDDPDTPRYFSSVQEAEEAARERWIHFQGPDAPRFGGEGLRRLYDQDFPAVVSKLAAVKQGGTKVEQLQVKIGTRERPMMPQAFVQARLRDAGIPLPIRNNSDPRIGRVMNAAQAEWERLHPNQDLTAEHPGFKVTPAMRRHVIIEGQALFQAKPGDIKGAYSPSSNVMRLVAGKADLSTFLHESGHFFLEVLTDIALDVKDPDTATPEEQQLLRDMDLVLKHGGYQGSLTEWRNLPLDDRRAVHEAFADAFEQYLFDGQSPNPALRPLFVRFRDWLAGVYRSARGKGIEISPELRGVFDRLMASDEAIADAQHEREVPPLFTDPAIAGVDALTFEAYRKALEEANTQSRELVDARLMADWRRERQSWWKAEREQVRQEVQAQVYAEPVYQALSIMRTGKLPDGSTSELNSSGKPVKLSKAVLTREVPRELAEKILAKRPAVFSVEGGVHPNVAAALFGFASGESLLEAIAAAKPMHQVIDATADQRMREKHGDLLLDGMKLQEVAEAAVFDQRRKVISAELRALTAGMTRSVIPPAAVLNQQAQEVIRRTPIRELNPGRYLAAARRASQQAFWAFGKNDRGLAIQHKQTELAALAFWRAARDAKDRADAIRDRLKRYADNPKVRARIGKAGQEYLDQIDGFLDRYEFARVSNKVLDRRESLRAFVKKVEADGLPNPIPDDVLDDARRVNWRDIPTEELEGVNQAVEQIAHLARLKNKLLKARNDRELSEVRAEIAQRIRESLPTREVGHTPRSASEQRRSFLEGWFASHRKIASLARELDGFKDGGPMWENVIRPMNDAGNEEASMQADATRRLAAIFNKHYSASEQHAFEKDEWIEALGPRDKKSARLNRAAQLMVALNWGNETNRQRLLAGKGWTEAQVQAILGRLDKRDFQFVQDVHDFINSYWPEIAAKEQRVKGVAPRKELAVPIYTRHGEFAGGYFPLMYEGGLSAQVNQIEEVSIAQMATAAAYLHNVTAHGHVEERSEGNVKLPVRLDMGVIFEHTARVIHDLTHHEALLDVQRVLNGPEVHAAIFDTIGPKGFQQFRRALHAIAVGDIPAQQEVESSLNYLRGGSTIAGLGWSFATAAMQPLGLTQSMQRIGVKWVAKGMAAWLRGAVAFEGVAADIQAESKLMANRMNTLNREVSEIRNQVRPRTIRAQALTDSFFYAITKMQLVADIPTYLGAKAKAQEAGHDEATAIALAEQAVLDAQGGGQQKDLAAVQRGGPAWKIWTNFYSFFNTTYNLWAESVHQAKVERDPRAIARLAADAMLLFVVPALLGHVMRAALTGNLGDELDDPEKLAAALAGELAAYMASPLIGVRELAQLLQGYAGYEGPAGARAFNVVGDLAAQAKQGELDEAFWRSLNAAGGVLLHYPAVQVDRTVRGVMALANGDTYNPLAVVMGPPKKKR